MCGLSSGDAGQALLLLASVCGLLSSVKNADQMQLGQSSISSAADEHFTPGLSEGQTFTFLFITARSRLRNFLYLTSARGKDHQPALCFSAPALVRLPNLASLGT